MKARMTAVRRKERKRRRVGKKAVIIDNDLQFFGSCKIFFERILGHCLWQMFFVDKKIVKI